MFASSSSACVSWLIPITLFTTHSTCSARGSSHDMRDRYRPATNSRPYRAAASAFARSSYTVSASALQPKHSGMRILFASKRRCKGGKRLVCQKQRVVGSWELDLNNASQSSLFPANAMYRFSLHSPTPSLVCSLFHKHARKQKQGHPRHAWFQDRPARPSSDTTTLTMTCSTPARLRTSL